MSNVLIGIIGVILFIGLALAGALFLGPRFQESSNTSKAAAVLQSLSQTGNAISMYRTVEGSDPFKNGGITGYGLTPTYLKTMPVNPMNPSTNPFLVASDGDGGSTGKRAETVAYAVPDDQHAVCEAVQRQVGQITSGQPLDKTQRAMNFTEMKTHQGCFWNGTRFHVYSRI